MKRREDQTGEMPQVQTEIEAPAFEKVCVPQIKFIAKNYLHNLLLL